MKKHSKTSDGSWLTKSAFVSFVRQCHAPPLYRTPCVIFNDDLGPEIYLFISRLLQSVIEFGSEIFEFIVRGIRNISGRDKILIMMFFFFLQIHRRRTEFFFINIKYKYILQKIIVKELSVLKIRIVATYVMISCRKEIWNTWRGETCFRNVKEYSHEFFHRVRWRWERNAGWKMCRR